MDNLVIKINDILIDDIILKPERYDDNIVAATIEMSNKVISKMNYTRNTLNSYLLNKLRNDNIKCTVIREVE